MLSLTDPKWGELKSNYGDGARVVELLSLAKSDVPSHTWYDELFQELLHQYTVSEAAYAAVPHLVDIASEREDLREPLLVLIGGCYTFSQAPEAAPIPAEFEGEWHDAARQAIPGWSRSCPTPGTGTGPTRTGTATRVRRPWARGSRRGNGGQGAERWQAARHARDV